MPYTEVLNQTDVPQHVLLENLGIKGKGRGKKEYWRGMLWVVREEEDVLSNHSSDPALLHQLLMESFLAHTPFTKQLHRITQSLSIMSTACL